MDVLVTPEVGSAEQRALRVALDRAQKCLSGSEPYDQAWRRAGLREGVDDDEFAGYAFSPRSTRGATRA